MFYDREYMVNLYNKSKKQNNYSYFLFTSLIKQERELSKYDFLVMLEKWKKALENTLSKDDVGYLVNRGNLLVIIENSRKNELIDKMRNFSYSRDEKAIILCDILELQEKETKILLY